MGDNRGNDAAVMNAVLRPLCACGSMNSEMRDEALRV